MRDAKSPRLAPLPREEWGTDERAALEIAYPGAAPRMLATGPDAMPIPNVLGTLAHNPALAGPFLVYNRVLLSQPTLGHRTRELIVLRVAWKTRSKYEWMQHVRLSERYDVTRDEIVAITRGAADDAWSPLEADVLTATDQLIDGYEVDDATWARLAEEFDAAQLIELTFTVGTYVGLAMAFNTFGLQLEPDLQSVDAPAFPED